MPPCTIGYWIPSTSQRGVLIIFVSLFRIFGIRKFGIRYEPTSLRVYEFTNLQLFGLLCLLFDLDNFGALIAATGQADVMWQSKFVTLRTRDKLRRFQGMMGTPVIPTPLGNFSLR
jgi:hypothetical protein